MFADAGTGREAQPPELASQGDFPETVGRRRGPKVPWIESPGTLTLSLNG